MAREKRYRRARRKHLVLDSYIVHSSHLFGGWMESFGRKLRQHFLPRYWPQENRIERRCLDLHAEVTRSHRCRSIHGVCKTIPGIRRRRLALAGAAILFGFIAGSKALAGQVHPALHEALSHLAPTDPASAIVVLKDQVDLGALKSSLAARRANRSEWHREVVEALREEALTTQGSLLRELELRREHGTVLGYTPYWIANLVVLRAQRAVIEELAQRVDVEQVEPNFTPVALAPAWSSTPGDDRDLLLAIGITPGLRAMHADRVWYELNIRGEGALIASLDTGVDGSHIALSSRWRGAGGAHPWQECWRDVLGTNTQFPIDASGHGTHVMGTLTGLAPYDSIGVAPAARWIAANAINQGVGSEFDNDVVNCFQWFADPDGNPNTVDDVPDVVQNSWGVNEGLGYPDCDARWHAVIDGCEASGVVVTWSAGGDGPGAGSIRSPADRASTLYNAFSVGTVNCSSGTTFPYDIASFSSRGPTNCDVPAERKIKPELCAPGVNVYSSLPGNSYGIYSGSAMAGAHLAGVVALMRSANPDLPVDDVKRILLETARDEGATGEDNTYGWGFVDAYEAVLRSMNPASELDDAPLGRTALFVNRPNPAREETRIHFRLGLGSEVTLSIHDAAGRRVRELVHGFRSEGAHDLVWDGRDDAGRAVASGVYFFQLETNGYRDERKLLLVR